MSSNQYSESRTTREESRRGTDGYDIPFNQRVTVPIQHSTNSFGRDPNELSAQERIRRHDTTVQWVNDPISGREKFRVTINIDGFNQNEVNIRVDGNKLIVYGEHVESKNQGSAKKIIEKSYELPSGIDTFSPHTSFPTLTTMQVDFPSRHAHAIIDDGSLSSKLVTNSDISHRTPPRFTQEKSSTEYTSTRKLGGGGGGTTNYDRISSPRTHSSYDELHAGSNIGRNNTYSSTSDYRSNEQQIPSRSGFISSSTDSSNNFSSSNNPTYTYRVTAGEPSTKTTYPLSSSGKSGSVQEQTYTESHRETQHRRSSPTTGVQSSREFEHHRSGSPSIAKSIDEDRFRSKVSLGLRSVTPPSSSRNVEVREYSRRVGGGSANNDHTNSFGINEPSLFTQGFNTDAFYRSAFQPQVFTDDHGQKRIEMKLDVNNYEPTEVKVSVNGNDLVVQAEHSVERPPTSSSRAYFYKQITLPPNTDLTTLSSQYHPDGKLHISAKISHEQSSIKHY